jgi:hypothetical protein
MEQVNATPDTDGLKIPLAHVAALAADAELKTQTQPKARAEPPVSKMVVLFTVGVVR